MPGRHLLDAVVVLVCLHTQSMQVQSGSAYGGSPYGNYQSQGASYQYNGQQGWNNYYQTGNQGSSQQQNNDKPAGEIRGWGGYNQYRGPSYQTDGNNGRDSIGEIRGWGGYQNENYNQQDASQRKKQKYTKSKSNKKGSTSSSGSDSQSTTENSGSTDDFEYDNFNPNVDHDYVGEDDWSGEYDAKKHGDWRKSVKWNPRRRGMNRTEWMKTHGMEHNTFAKLKRDVLTCKILRLRKWHRHMDIGDLAMYDEFLSGVMPSTEQVKNCMTTSRRRIKRKMTNFDNRPTAKWIIPVQYKFDGGHDIHDRNMIETAIRHWETHTCLRFKRIANNANIQDQHILFTDDSGGCWSYVARVNKSEAFPQQINLQSSRLGLGGCTDMLGTPTHEIGHVLGLWHEHVRHDRDNYVNYNEKNVKSWHQNNFDIIVQEIYKNLVEYDLGSIMHYGPDEMSSGNGLSLTTKNPLYQGVIGQRVGLSFHDIKVVNEVYCKHHCQMYSQKKCKNSGYRNPIACHWCKCPEGLGGRHCGVVAPANGGCWPSSSKEIDVTSTEERYVETRNFRKSGYFKIGDRCHWLFVAPPGCTINVHFEGQFGLHCTDDTCTCLHWVEIKYKKNLSSRGPRFCGKKAKLTGTLTSESNRMLVIFDGRYPLASNLYTKPIGKSHLLGFRLVYRLTNQNCFSARTNTQTPFVGHPIEPIVRKTSTRPCKPYPTCTCQQWEPWSSWSSCSRTCGGCGVKVRYRKCKTPLKIIEKQTAYCGVAKCAKYEVQYTRMTANLQRYQSLATCCHNFNYNPPKKLTSTIKCHIVTPGK